MNKLNLQQATEIVCNELKNDSAYRLAWEANIAMAFKDQFAVSGEAHDSQIVHKIANRAAAAFIDQLVGKDVGDVDGMAAISQLHNDAAPLN